MNGLILAVCAILAVATASPSHIGLGGAVVAGPAGIITGHGAVGTVSVGAGLGLHGGAVLTAPSAAAVVTGPALAPAVVAGPGLGVGAVLAGPALAVGHGLGAITAGGGAIGVSAHGAAVRGPPTVPVVISGPSGRIAADGLWGPTANVGLGAHGHGHW